MVPFIIQNKRGKANSEADLCIFGFVTCYMSHSYVIDAPFYRFLNSGSNSTKIMLITAKLTEQ